MTVTWPCNFSISPRIADIIDDLPAPTWPTTAYNDSSGTCRLMLLHNDHRTNKMLSYRIEIALQGVLVLAKSDRLELGDNTLRTL